MKIYTKIHSLKKAAENHLRNINRRGGRGTISTVKDGFLLEYSFSDDGMADKKFIDVLSPDGFTIRIGVPPFKTMKESFQYFAKWAKRYKRKGYYSSNEYGRIHLEDLDRYCRWIWVDKAGNSL
jgi:hypothetical protein